MADGVRVGDVMTRKFVHVSPESSLFECANKMIKNRVGSIVVKQNEKLHGIITEKDIVWAVAKKKANELNNIKVKDIATKRIITIKPEATLKEALEKLNKNKLRRMPVVNNNRIIGYITLKDIVKFIPEVFEESREFERIREESEKIKRSESLLKGEGIEDICEECGDFELLESVDGRMICQSCKDKM
ncbi:MAG: CBS domain-containing protein [Candidatus Pacearchaeota archaeon]